MGERIDFVAGPYRRWRAKRRKVYQCEVCGRWLRRDQIVEVGAVTPGDRPGEFGGIVATYCRQDAP